MVIVIARVRIRPEEKQRALSVLEEVQAKSREDDGCLRYGYFFSIDEPDRFIAVEEWRDQDALNAHLTTPHIRTLVASLPGVVAEPPVIEVHEVASTGPMRVP